MFSTSASSLYPGNSDSTAGPDSAAGPGPDPAKVQAVEAQRAQAEAAYRQASEAYVDAGERDDEISDDKYDDHPGAWMARGAAKNNVLIASDNVKTTKNALRDANYEYSKVTGRPAPEIPDLPGPTETGTPFWKPPVTPEPEPEVKTGNGGEPEELNLPGPAIEPHNDNSGDGITSSAVAAESAIGGNDQGSSSAADAEGSMGGNDKGSSSTKRKFGEVESNIEPSKNLNKI